MSEEKDDQRDLSREHSESLFNARESNKEDEIANLKERLEYYKDKANASNAIIKQYADSLSVDGSIQSKLYRALNQVINLNDMAAYEAVQRAELSRANDKLTEENASLKRRLNAYADIEAECLSQSEKWGEPHDNDNTTADWVAILHEQVTGLWKTKTPDAAYMALIKIMAVAMSAMLTLERKRLVHRGKAGSTAFPEKYV